jgi:hypothetical protein
MNNSDPRNGGTPPKRPPWFEPAGARSSYAEAQRRALAGFASRKRPEAKNQGPLLHEDISLDGWRERIRRMGPSWSR